MSNDKLVIKLRELECELHLPEVRRNSARLNALLHSEFEEVGRSGRQWSRDAAVKMLISETVHVDVIADAFVATELQPGVALLTYRSAHRHADGSLTGHTLRSSVWVLVRGNWQMRYHQGTIAAETW